MTPTSHDRLVNFVSQRFPVKPESCGTFSALWEKWDFFYFQSLKHVSNLGTGYYETPKVLAFALDGSSLVIENTQLNEPSRCVCVSHWHLLPSPPAVLAVFSLFHSLVFICPAFGGAPNPHLHPGLISGLPCFVVHLCFPTRACLGPSGPPPCFPSATCVVTAKDSHLQPSPEKALGPGSCPTGRQMPANNPFHLSLGTRVSVPSRLLVRGRLLL